MSEPPRLPLGDAPAFREPWQAKAFALVVALHQAGHFTWDEWVRTLSAEIARAPQRGDETAEAAYHRQFLAALEAITAATGLATADARAERKEAWRRAYLNTPHGQPVALAAADHHHDADDDHHHHGLAPQREPVAVSPARRAG